MDELNNSINLQRAELLGQFIKSAEYKLLEELLLKEQDKKENIAYLCEVCHFYVPWKETREESIKAFEEYKKVKGLRGSLIFMGINCTLDFLKENKVINSKDIGKIADNVWKIIEKKYEEIYGKE